LDAQEKEVWITVRTQDERLGAWIQIVTLARTTRGAEVEFHI
jgi:hypothetical protein